MIAVFEMKTCGWLGRVFVAGALLTACGGSPTAVVRTRGASDLRCDQRQVEVIPPPDDKDALSDSPYPYYARGCGRIARYLVSYCYGLAGCTVTDAQMVSTMVRKQASFDLQCADKDIALEVLNRDAIGAEGCGKRASYALTDCDPPSLTTGGDCKVTANAPR